MARKIEVQIVGDASSLHRALGSATSGSSKLGKTLGVGLRGAAVAAGVGLGALAVAAKIGFDEFQQHTKVVAQTNAVLKSTGKVANVSAKQVDALAQSLMQKSGVDDEVIQSGENMLLTFRGIRNETGKNNDIFNQATEATLDLSVAMGKDMSTSAILVGKALQDPIRGLGALRRVGIQFTKAQEAQIKKMVESGDVMGAQKLILQELNAEFGGSAEAVGKTLPGQLNILKESFRDAMGSAMEALVPFITQLTGWANKHMPEIQAKVTAAMTGIATVVATVAEFINAHWGTITAVFNAVVGAAQTVVSFFQTNWPKIRDTVVTVFGAVRDALNQAIAYYQGTVAPAIQNVLAAIRGFWDRFGADIIRIVRVAFGIVKNNIATILAVIGGVIEFWLAVFRGDWSDAWGKLKGIARTALMGVITMIEGLASLFYAAGAAIGQAIVNGIKGAISQIWSWISGLVGRAVRAALPFGGGQGGAQPGAPQPGDRAPRAGAISPRALGGGAVSVNFNGPVYGDPKSIAQAVREEFVKMQRNGAKLGFTSG